LQRPFSWVLPLLLAVVCHEVSHGWVADAWATIPPHGWAASRSIRSAHRSRRHDLLPGLLLLTDSSFLFGYAKAGADQLGATCAIPARDMVLVAVAGPVTNSCSRSRARVRSGFSRVL
jgi:hypothetical protein